MDSKEQVNNADHRPPAKIPSKYLKVIEMDPKERPVALIRRHPIGLIGILFSAGILMAILLAVSIISGAFLDNTDTSSLPFSASTAVFYLGIGLSIVILISSLVRAFVYNNSVIIITTDKVVQVLYRTIISRSIIQFSLGEVTDVTVVQNGVLARAFDFGTITIETAGEQEECIMNFVPYPHGCSKSIMSAHERNIQQYGN